MGRELRRKQAKKEGKSLEKDEIIETNQIKRYIINVLVIVLIFAFIYLISGIFITKELDWFKKKDSDTTNKTDNSVANSILASSIFMQKEESYYVYFYDFNEKDEDSEITNLVNSSLSNEKVYKVNTSSAMNANYVADSSNKNAKSLNDLKVVNQTLINITNDTITEYYEKNEIKTKLS